MNEQKLSFKEAAFQILKAEKEPLSPKEIVELAFQRELLSSDGKTPHASMAAQLYVDINKNKKSKFKKVGKGKFSLIEQIDSFTTPLLLIDRQNALVKNALMQKLYEMDPFQFEFLIADLLTQIGYENVEVTRRNGDKGIDVTANLTMDGITNVKTIIQAKRYKKGNNIAGRIITQLRGSAEVDQRGLVITTSDFTKDAVTESKAQNKMPVSLVNGNKLLQLLIKYEVGIKKDTITLYSLDNEYFENEGDIDKKQSTFDKYRGLWPLPGGTNNYIETLYEDSSGTLWIGTRAGLDEFNRKTASFFHHQSIPGNPQSLSAPSVRVMYEDRDGTLWVGTTHGLNTFDTKTKLFTHYFHNPQNPFSLSSNHIMSIHQDKAGTLWIGTSQGGLNRLDLVSKRFTHYREKDGLPSDVVYGILEDEHGNLWLSTNQGLSVFDPQTETFKNYTVQDGLQSNEFNKGAYYQSESGEMFFGGINGLNTFYPDQLRENRYIPPIVLTALTQGGERVILDRPLETLSVISFSWPSNFFEFEFAALSYSQPDKNQYAYRLEPFDEDWISLGAKRNGRYTNLPGGDYTLHIAGSNNDGVWNEQGTSIAVTIVPPFWQTPTFQGLLALTLIVSVLGGYQLRVRSVETRSQMLAELVDERTAALSSANQRLRQEIAERQRVEDELAAQAVKEAVAAERNRLARDLHDAVTQTLFSASLIAEVLPRLWQRSPDEGQRRLAELRELTRGALAEMRTLLLELRPAALTDTSLGELLQQLAESITGRARVPIDVTIEHECEIPSEIKVALYRIAQEALNNVARHAAASRASVHLQCQPAQIKLTICDDGRGFIPENLSPKSLGLGIMRERAETIHAELEIKSQLEKGTEVVILWHNDAGEQK